MGIEEGLFNFKSRFTRCFFLIIFVIAVITLIWFANPKPHEDIIYSKIEGVNEIVLEHYPDEWTGPFSIFRANCAGFRVVYYEGQSYHYMGSGATLSFNENSVKARYLVEERLLENELNKDWPEKIALTIIDTETGEELAYREVWQNQSNGITRVLGAEGTGGYKGEISAAFVRSTLNPNQSRWSSTCTTSYPTTVFSIDAENAAIEVSKEEFLSKETNCPNAEIEEHFYRLDIRVTTENWSYKPAKHPNHIYCLGDNIFIFSKIFWGELYIDWLNLNGELLGQYQIHSREEPFNSDLRHFHIQNIYFSSDELKISRIEAPNSEVFNQSGVARQGVTSTINIDLINSHGRHHWCVDIGEKASVFGLNEEGCENSISPPNPLAVNATN